MPQCPTCHTDVGTPLKIWSIPADPDRRGVFAERKVGLYQCPRCRSSFPFSIGSRRLKIVDADEWEKLAGDSRALTAVSEKLRALEEENQSLRKLASSYRENAEIERLKAKVDALSGELLILREIKQGLEEDLNSQHRR